MKVYFDDPGYDGQLLRTLGHAYDGGADIGECLTTAQRITPGDDDGWYDEWCATADRLRAAGDASLAAGRRVSAREAYLRASEYYRTAFIFMFKPPIDPRAVAALDKSREAFRAAGALFTPAFEAVEIPYEGTTLPGYFFRTEDDRTARPTLIVPGGYDGTAEECYFAIAGALRRGYNALCFDGPGQGAALFKQHLVMRPDWEHVVTPVVDYALTRPEVDARRIVLMGKSWGGYLAPRAATAEHRLAACIADPGLVSPVAGITAMLPPAMAQQLKDGDASALTPALTQMMQSPEMAFTINRGMLVHGAATPFDYLHGMLSYTLEGLAGQITCPTLVTQAENDERASQAQQLYDALTCPKALIKFTNAEGAGEHCEAGATALFDQRVFDWLDATIA